MNWSADWCDCELGDSEMLGDGEMLGDSELGDCDEGLLECNGTMPCHATIDLLFASELGRTFLRR